MHSNTETAAVRKDLLERFTILLPGIPAFTSRGWLGYCTTVLFRLNDRWALYDAGHYSDRSQVLAALAAARIEPADIGYVVLSHLHFDHVLNLPLFRNAVVILAQAELDYARAVSAGILEDHAIPESWPELLKERELHAVQDSMALDAGMEAVVIPGHTPGCLVLFCDTPVPVAICGDALKNGWEIYRPPAATEAGIETIKTRARIFIPGHDRPFLYREEGLEYLCGYDFTIAGNVFPGSENEVLLELHMTEGFKPEPVR